jgi:hypothetical protein
MRKARGYLVTRQDGKIINEVDTFTCCHCDKIVDTPPGKSATSDGIGAWCHCCNAPMCLQCVGKGCTPIERWLEQCDIDAHYNDLLGRR